MSSNNDILKSTIHLRENNELYVVIGLKHFFMKKGLYQRINIEEITGVEINLENIFDAFNNLEKECERLKQDKSTLKMENQSLRMKLETTDKTLDLFKARNEELKGG